MPGNIQIQKASGDIQDFSEQKLGNFLRRIKVPDQDVDRIVTTITAELTDYVPIGKLREIVVDHLQKLPQGELFVARYMLKSAMRRLGPAGHLFEHYAARLFQADGYTDVHTSVMIQGECTMHEVDIVATKNGEHHIAECKFHNQDGTKSDVTVALYSYARFLDVKDTNSLGFKIDKCWIITNTKLTQDAVNYAACKGMPIISMEHPMNTAILDRVVEEGLFPLASAPLSDQDLSALHDNDFVMLSDVLKESALDIAARSNVQQDVISNAQAFARRILNVDNE